MKPRCKGGATSWENLVAACRACNSKKGNKELSQLGPQFELRRKPTKPSKQNVKQGILDKLGRKQPWAQYLQQVA